MSDDIYHNVLNTEIQGTDREEMMVDIYESGDDLRTQTDSNTNRQQPIQSTGSECARMKSYRSVTVCLVLLCVLLLTAVIVLCVLIKNFTKERDQLLTKYTNITEERDYLIAKFTVAAELFVFTDGWIYYQFSFYYISSEEKNWNDSRRYCRDRGADLIIINNKEEQDFIEKNDGDDKIWIGLTDSDEKGNWKWVDGSTLNSSFWKSGEPNRYGGDKDCAVFESTGWADYRCTRNFKWICERKILK
ncbi:uncharacterized protein [Misgurnus anguillicaudatus]|uniref:uncharacterized protein n=1 Tax=Misgurnus anguillicaudatus TaxID=75329 RepID=UPI003CCF1799